MRSAGGVPISVPGSGTCGLLQVGDSDGSEWIVREVGDWKIVSHRVPSKTTPIAQQAAALDEPASSPGKCFAGI